MIKIAFIALFMVTLSIAVIFFTTLSQRNTAPLPSPVQPATESGSQQNTSTDAQSQTSSGSDEIDSRLSALESAVRGLQNNSSTSSSQTIQAAAPLHQYPLYIPMGTGSGGAVSSLDWTTTTTPQAIIDADDYPGYTSFQLIMSLRIFQGNGQAFAQLYDVTDGTGISGSIVSSSLQDYTPVVSGKFQLPKGQKTYQIQLRSTTAYEADFQDISLKVNFN